MSIIHEALKKAQSDLEKQGNSNPADQSITKLYEDMHRPSEERNKAADTSLKEKSQRQPAPGPCAQTLTQKPASSNISSAPAAQRGLTQEMTRHLRASPAPSKKKSWFKLIVTLACLFLVGTGVLFGIFLYLSNDSAPTSSNVIQPKFSKTKNAPQPTAENPLILSGTMMMENKRVALINNGIYEVNDMVEGKKVLTITLEKVELLDGENIITLKAVK